MERKKERETAGSEKLVSNKSYEKAVVYVYFLQSNRKKNKKDDQTKITAPDP